MSSVRDTLNIDFLPSVDQLDAVQLKFLPSVEQLSCQSDSGCAIGYLVTKDEEPPADDGWTWDALAQFGFKGDVGQTMVFPQSASATNILVGLGDATEAGPDQFREAGAAFARALGQKVDGCINFEGRGTPADIQAFVEGALLARYSYRTFKSDSKNATPFLRGLTVIGGDGIDASAGATAVERAREYALATFVARDLVNAPPAHLNPESFADQIIKMAGQFNFEAEVFGLDKLDEMGCGGLVGVNRGSSYAARMVHLTYTPEGGAANANHVALVGKGITFDSGGLSLKGAGIMLDMKSDMGGAAAILGAFSSFQKAKVTQPVQAWLAITDNMVSGNSLRVGEILTARNGKTVEINNTDAEGRLVLMDALSLAVETKPEWVVDLATLTGAQIIALGNDVAAVMGNNAGVVNAVEEAALATGEDVWELPMPQRYMKIMKSDLADLSNANMSVRAAGSITAGMFLSEFVGETPWAHIDIAGPAASIGASDRWLAPGATGFGARLVLDLVANNRSE